MATVPRSAALGSVQACILTDHHAVLSHRVLNSDEIFALGHHLGQVCEIDP